MMKEVCETMWFTTSFFWNIQSVFGYEEDWKSWLHIGQKQVCIPKKKNPILPYRILLLTWIVTKETP